MIEGLKPYAEYKESRLPWHGSVPDHWAINRLKTIFREVDDRSTTGKERLLSLRMNSGLVDHHLMGGRQILPSTLINYKRAYPGQIVMNRMRASMGLFGTPTKVGLVSPDYAVLSPKRQVVLSYYLQLFKSPLLGRVFRTESRGLGTGESGFLRLYFDTFGVLAVPFPPLDEQAAIVRFLDHANSKIDGLIRAKRKLIGLLNEQKQAIIHRAVTRGLDPGVPLKASGIPWLGGIPRHWEVRRAKQLCSRIVDCKNRTPDSVPNGKFTVVRTTNVRQARFNIVGSFRTDRRSFEIWTERGAPRVGDVFFTREAPVGEACLVPEMSNLCMGQRMMYFRPDPAVLDSEFLLHSIYGPVVRTYIENVANGSTVGHLRLGQVNAMPLLWCPLDEQQAIVRRIYNEAEPLTNAITRTEREIALMQEYRTRLTADIVTGKLDVRAAAAKLPDPPAAPTAESEPDELAEEIETEGPE